MTSLETIYKAVSDAASDIATFRADATDTLEDLGFDSLDELDFRTRVEKELGVESLGRFGYGMSLVGIAAEIDKLINGGDGQNQHN